MKIEAKVTRVKEQAEEIEFLVKISREELYKLRSESVDLYRRHGYYSPGPEPTILSKIIYQIDQEIAKKQVEATEKTIDDLVKQGLVERKKTSILKSLFGKNDEK